MAVYSVQVPDGSVLKIEAPDSATPEQIEAFAKANWKQPQTARSIPPTSKAPALNMGALVDTVKDLPAHASRAGLGFAQGVGDLAVGAGQLVSHIADPLIPGSANRFDEYMRSRESDYQQTRDTDRFDIGRATGFIVPTLATGGAAPAANIFGRMGQGAKLGGILGAASPVNPDAPSFAAAKGIQTGIGAVAGGLAPPVVEGLSKAATGTINALANQFRGVGNTLTGQTSPTAIEATLKIELQRGGIDWNALSQSVRDSMVQNIQGALKTGGKLDPEAIRRQADFMNVGVLPTKGQISRDPRQFAMEQNLSKMEVGKPLADRFTEQNTQMIGALDRARPGQSADTYQAGQSVIKSIAARDAPRKAAVTQAYDEARGLAGIEADVPLQPVAQRLGNIIEDFGDDKIPGAVSARLKEFGLLEGKQTKVFNIREAEKLKTLIGNNIDNPNSPSGKALTMLKKSVDDSINALADGGAGAEAATAFQKARGTAAQRFGAIDRSPALQEVIAKDTTAPEKFIEKHFIRGEVQGVANNLRSLTPEARSEVRGAVIDWIKGQTLIGGASDAAKFSQAGLNKALKTLGERKLDLIFAGDRQTLEMLKSLGRVGSYAQTPPVASGVNFSNSATTILDAMDKATRLPIVGALLGKPGDVVRATQAASAVAPAVPVGRAPPLMDPAYTNELAKRLGLIAAPAAPAFGISGLLGR